MYKSEIAAEDPEHWKDTKLRFDKEDEAIIDMAFEEYRRNGFPYPQTMETQMLVDFFKARDTESKIVANQKPSFLDSQYNKVLEVTALGLNIVNQFHSHIFESHAIHMFSPIESFEVDHKLRRCIELAWIYDRNIGLGVVRRLLRVVLGTQMCSNFRPLAAKAIYEKYLKGRRTFDSSTGYGGRLLGFMLADIEDSHYYGVDPAKITCEANKEMVKFLSKFATGKPFNKRVHIYCSTMEDFDISRVPSNFDLVFSSPPYFHKEWYSNDPEQSHTRYKQYDSWKRNFWYVSLKKSWEMLRGSGYLVINIANITIRDKTYPLLRDTIHYAKKLGFDFKEEQNLLLKMSGFGRGLKKRKTEPILVFRKPKGVKHGASNRSKTKKV